MYYLNFSPLSSFLGKGTTRLWMILLHDFFLKFYLIEYLVPMLLIL